MTEAEYIDARIEKIRTALLERPPGVQMATFNGVTVMYSSLEQELNNLVAKRAALTQKASSFIRSTDISGAY